MKHKTLKKLLVMTIVAVITMVMMPTLTMVADTIWRTVTIDYIDRQGNPLKEQTILSELIGSTYTITYLDIDNYVPVEWKKDGALQSFTYPNFLVDKNIAIILVYGTDYNNDSKEDIKITKQYQTSSGTTLADSESVIVNIGDTFEDDESDRITGYTYSGFIIDGSTTQTGNPSIAVNAGDGNFIITYIYYANSYGDSGRTYGITYDANGGGGGKIVKENGNGHYILTQDEADVSRSGYSFSGWNTKADGSGTSYSASELLILGGDITLYAQWTQDSSDTDTTTTTDSDIDNTDTDDTNIDNTDIDGPEPDIDDTDTSNTDSDTADTDSTTRNAYISGYADGTFKPDGSITRAEVAQMLYNIIGADDSGQGSIFSDVTSNNWYYAPITYLTDEGIISGYEDGTFKPNSNITRAEFITLVVKYAGLTLKDSTSFADVSESHWAYQYIAAAEQASYVGGYEDGTFRPDSALSRAEAVTILNAMLGRKVDETALSEISMPFSDVPKTHWAYYQILEAAVEQN